MWITQWSSFTGGAMIVPPRPSSLEPHQAAAFALPAALLFRLALVVEFLAAAERDLDLGAPLVVEEQLERHDGHALTVDRSRELVDLATMQQQLARALRRMVERLAWVFGMLALSSQISPPFASA
jgi:hypothetical protein